MVLIEVEATDWLLRWDDAPHRSVALRHAAIHGRPGLWGDDPARPSSVVWLREGDEGRWEAFGAGLPEPSIGWLASRSGGRPISMMAPESWEAPARSRAERLDRASVQTWTRPEPPVRRASPVQVRRLEPADAPAFEAVAPTWALRSWGDFASMVARGAGFGVPNGEGEGFASMAWIYESDRDHDKIGVATAAPFRRLGLGRAASMAMVEHILRDRRKAPLWTTHEGNTASMALARSLGFGSMVTETLLHWTPLPSEI
jgi:RimJ/RimL family protein N-acetyltransferase